MIGDREQNGISDVTAAFLEELRESAGLRWRILEEVAAGKSIGDICRQYAVSRYAFHKFVESDPEFAQQLLVAKRLRAEARVEEAVEIADTATPGDVNVAKLRVDVRKWLAEAEDPAMYGKRAQVTMNFQQVHLTALKEFHAGSIQGAVDEAVEVVAELEAADDNNGDGQGVAGSLPE